MKPNKDPKNHWRDLCADLHDDDGLNPAEDKRQKAQANDQQLIDRTTQRLCAQAARAIRMALLADCGDSDLQSLDVSRVEPWPDARRLRVHLATSSTDLSAAELTDKVNAVSHLLRHAVARSITRKRSPQLIFVITASPDVGGVGDA